jgi:hypothetical protein
MKKKNRKKKVIRRKRRSKSERRVMKIKRGLLKRAKKLRLGVKRTGAYVYGTLRRIVGNPDHRTRIALQTVRRPMEGYFLGGPDLEESVRFLIRKGYTMAQLKKINPDVEDELSGKKSILPNSRRGLRGNPGKELTLWGYNPKPGYGLTGPIRLAEYRSQKQQDEYNKEGWITGVYAKGDEPVGLNLKVEEMRRGLRGNPMEYDVLSDKYIVTGSPYRDRMKALLTHIYAMRDAGKSQAAMKPFIKEYKNLKRIVTPLRSNRMRSHRTHGLSLKQMMKLYRMVSRGNPRAVKFAKSILGIPASESLSQVKAVVYHHVLDLKGKV